MKKGGNKKQTPAMGVAALGIQNSFSPNSQVLLGPSGENTVGCKWGSKYPELCEFW